ncbi:MAG: hypothetical protein ATN35_09245 [Epulopiscium sp. Nele67-Bin004]|nr:MAG: hypothetical protein ATN35_09245 [Epulopiscium sp. Nele67-Bin004]
MTKKTTKGTLCTGGDFCHLRLTQIERKEVDRRKGMTGGSHTLKTAGAAKTLSPRETLTPS